jgi:hypothetical protein
VDDGAHVVIRPLVYIGEEEARAYYEGIRATDHRAAARRAAIWGCSGSAPSAC